MLEKAKKFVLEKKTAAAVAATGALSTVNMTMAASQEPNQTGEGFSGIKDSLGVIIQWIAWGGMVIAFFGVIQLILAFQRDDSEGKSRGVHTLLVGGMLALASIFAGFFGLV